MNRNFQMANETYIHTDIIKLGECRTCLFKYILYYPKQNNGDETRQLETNVTC